MMPFTISDLLIVIVFAIAACAFLALGPAAHAGDIGNALIWAAKHDHHDKDKGAQ